MTQIESAATESPVGKWKCYPAYKDSGVEWLGQVPKHWDLAPLYSHYSIQLGKMRNQDNITGLALAPYLRNVNIQWDHVDISDVLEMDFDPAERRKYTLSYGDLLVCEGGDVGRTAIWRGELAECYIQNAVHRVRPLTPKEEGRFLFYALYTVANLGVFKAEVNRSTIGHLTSEKLKKYRFMFPPLREQRAITAFLDRETARIYALIAKKERLIELLQEKRAALISHAVTKGLDPTVPMKDSGVEWLGEIPVHWEVAPVYSRYNVQLGKMLNQEAVKGISPAPYLRNVNIQWDYVDLSEILEMDFNPLERQKYDLIFGDLLVCEGGEVGRTAIWRGELTECYFQKAIHRVRPLSPQEDGRFLFYVLYAAANLGVFKAEGNKSTIVHLTAEKLKRHRFAFPSLTEQRGIILFLDHETAKIDALISKIQEGIEKLKEYSTALVSAAVTGKIDVRETIEV